MIGPTLMALGHRGRRSATSSPGSSPARTSGARATPSRTPAPTWPTLGTRAVLDGDEWVINGQKIWTTARAARQLDLRALPAPTPDVPKHAGITFLLCPMDQPGIEIRPIINIARGHEFNEVFFTDARTARENVVGEVNNGWAVTNTLLAFERGGRATVAVDPLPRGAEPPAGRGPGAGRHRRPARPPGPGLVPLHRWRSCATWACAPLTSLLAASGPGRSRRC